MAGNRFTNFGGRCWGVEKQAELAWQACRGTGFCSAGMGELLDLFCLRTQNASTASIPRSGAGCDEAAHIAG